MNYRKPVLPGASLRTETIFHHSTTTGNFQTTRHMKWTRDKHSPIESHATYFFVPGNTISPLRHEKEALITLNGSRYKSKRTLNSVKNPRANFNNVMLFHLHESCRNRVPSVTCGPANSIFSWHNTLPAATRLLCGKSEAKFEFQLVKNARSEKKN